MEIQQRDALLQVIVSKNRSALQELLKTGIDVNFLAVFKEVVASPLALSCVGQWEEGTLMLLDAGASPSQVNAFYNALSPQERRTFQQGNRWESVEQAVMTPSVFERLLHLESQDSKFCHRLVKQAFRCEWGPQALVKHHLVKGLGEADRLLVEGSLMLAAFRSSDALPVLKQFWQQVPEHLLVEPERRWHVILRQDARAVMELLIGLQPSQAPSSFLAHVRLTDVYHLGLLEAEGALPFPMEPLTPRSTPIPMRRTEYKDQSDALPVWLCALLLGATHCLRYMADNPEWMAPLQDVAQRQAWLALCTKAPTLREAARQGLDLTQCKNEANENPLHYLCGQQGPKQPILDLARVHPAWIMQASLAGQTPIDRLPDALRQGPLAAALETFVLEQSLGRRNERGRKVPQRKAKVSRRPMNKTQDEGSSVATAVASAPRARRRL